MTDGLLGRRKTSQPRRNKLSNAGVRKTSVRRGDPGLSKTQFKVLNTLTHLRTVASVATTVKMTEGAVHRILNRLIDQDLVDWEKRNAVLRYRVTDQGNAILGTARR